MSCCSSSRVMGGRVIPMFTNNGVPGAAATRQPHVEKLGARAGAGPPGRRCRRTRGNATEHRGAGSLRRPRPGAGALWQPWKTRRVAAGVGAARWPTSGCRFTWRCAPWPALGLVAPSAATHALTVGAVGGLIIGMMTRTARGHTARPLRADRYDTACYVLVLLAAVVRVGAAARRAGADPPRGARLGRALVGGLRPVRRPLLARAVAATPGRPAGVSYGLLRGQARSPGRRDAVGRRLLRSRSGFVRAARDGSELARAKTLPHLVDTVLLLSALTLAWMLRLTPGNAPWLLAKIVGPGRLRRARRRRPATRTAACGSRGGLARRPGDRGAGSSRSPSRRALSASSRCSSSPPRGLTSVKPSERHPRPT